MKSFAFIFMLMFSCVYAQITRIIRFTSSHTSFPDTGRANGHQYNKKMYDAVSHYQDSSVLVYVPAAFDPGKPVNMTFWFHGWQNNIDTAAVYFNLFQQFEKAGINSVLVLAETASNAPDSYGGKLERKNEFSKLVADVMGQLKKQRITRKKKTGTITLAGHSGAYRVMAYILQNGGVQVQNVFLFDALYGETAKYYSWLKDPSHRLINIFTNGGGTDVQSKQMVADLQQQKMDPVFSEESDVSLSLLKANRIVVIHSLHNHNDVIKDPDNFSLFLKAVK